VGGDQRILEDSRHGDTPLGRTHAGHLQRERT
jgi:hypothetical protein